ncbi:MAG: OmpA family protein, partial [Treponema sp.]|nr:OmpA family protein [Treponema sp.]
RDMRESAQAVDAIIPVHFEVNRDGSTEIENDQGFPMLRGFPSFPNQSVTQGEKWRAPGNRAVDPFNLGRAVVIPFTAEYEYRGTENYNGTPVHRIFAAYGYNFRNEIEPHPYARVTGRHRVDILIRAADGLIIFMRDDLNITYTLAGGMVTEFRGFTITFGSGIIPMDRDTVIASLEDTLDIDPPAVIPDELPDIDLTPVPEGIKLTIRDIRFAADLPEILPEERSRLDLLAAALSRIPDRTFLVEGHTASIGRPADEMRLSIERARSIINELVRRGISAGRFVYIGWGGTKPIGDNTTDSGRRANRRVEITILE